MKHHIMAALFDLDGVIAFTDRYHYLAWKRLADEEGWRFGEQVNHQLRGVPRMASLEVILRHNNLVIDEEEKRSLAGRKNVYYVDFLCSINKTDLYPGAIDLLVKLKAEGAKLGLCSSSQNAGMVLDALDLRKYFDAVVTGNDVTRPKPDPQIFQMCAKKLNLPAHHCIVFEDAVSGIEAALAARMKAVGVGTVQNLPNAPEHVTDYAEIDVGFLLDTGRVSRFPEEPWNVSETVIRPKRARYWESLFALTNGYMGLRGTHEEEDPLIDEYSYPGMFVNRIYGYKPWTHAEYYPGFSTHLHSMLNLADWRIINLFVGGERFSLFSGKVRDYCRTLDLKRGVSTRSLMWESPTGAKVSIKSTRVVSMKRRHCAAIRYQVTAVQSPASVTLESKVRATVDSEELGAGHTELVSRKRGENSLSLLIATTSSSTGQKGLFKIGAEVGQAVHGGTPTRDEAFADAPGDVFVKKTTVQLQPGQSVILDKFAAFYTTHEAAELELCDKAAVDVLAAMNDGFPALLAEQERFWHHYWKLADIQIDGNTSDQQALRFTMFHLRQSNPEDDKRSIGANGMTGDKYRGHVFWDTEMYLAPHFLYTEPKTVRPLLMYRYSILDRARERAVQMQGKGALYSWNSISGEECGVVFEASTAEYHLVSDIAWAISRYVQHTSDTGFLYDYGAEMLFETARFIEGRGAYIPTRGNKFCVNIVCGPDEYGCGVNNNLYTNTMFQWHLRYAQSVYQQMAREAPEKLMLLSERIGLSAEETKKWKMAADRMYIPYHNGLKIHMQDDSFLYLDPVDMNTIARNTDIRETMHPLNLWRIQVAKQADVVLTMFVQGHQYSLDQKKRNYEYYEPRTNHGSSLSACIHSIEASEIGKLGDAYDYFRQSVMMDLNDFKDNTGGGIHSACLGGTWMAVVNGFGGMRDYPDGLHFRPVLPSAWKGYRFSVLYKGSRIAVDVTGKGAQFKLIGGPAVSFTVGGKRVSLNGAGKSVTAPVKASLAAKRAVKPPPAKTPKGKARIGGRAKR
jgi:alpha,alpha-trehalose phosphorylase